MKKIIIRTAAILIAAAMLLTGCRGNDNQNENDDETETSKTNDNFTPASDDGIWDVIPEIPVSDASSFEYHYDNGLGGMVVTDYLKESPKVRIPDTLEDEPVVKVDFSELKKELTHLVMPDGVADFSLSSKIKGTLQYVNLPKGISEIDENTFNGCESLIGVHIPDSVSVIGSDAFAFRASLANINIPDSVTEIGSGAFRECSSLIKINIPDSVTNIGNGAFSGCTSLTKIKIHDSVTKIGSDAFENCKSLTATFKGKTYNYEHINDLYNAINMSDSGLLIENGILIKADNNLTEVIIPDGVTEISSDAFKGCTNLSEIIIPDSVVSLEESTFDGLKNTTITYKNKTYDYEHRQDLYDLFYFIMPNLIGLSWDEAIALYGGENSLLKLDPHQEWSEAAPNEILDQDQPEGKRVKIGTSVNVKVSKGIRSIEIQDFTNRSDTSAEQQLKKDGFIVKKEFDYDENIPEGHVIKTTPPAHETAEQGSTVILTVSLGPKNTSVKMPKLTDIPITEALELCNQYHLTPIIKKEVPSEKEKGTVLTQSIKVGELVDRNTEVELTVSTGKIPTMVSAISLTLPAGLNGRFEFIYLENGVIVKREERDISITAARSIKYDLQGKSGEKRQFAIRVRYPENNKEATYLEIEVDFSTDPPSQTEKYKNSGVFITLPLEH